MCRYVLLVIDSFSKCGRAIHLKNKKTQTIENSSKNILITLERKPNLIETDRGKEFYNNFVQNLLNNNDLKHYFRNIYLGAVFAERFNRTIRGLLKRPVFEKGESNCIHVLPIIRKQYNNRVRTSTKLTPIQDSLEKNEGFVYHNLLDKRRKIKPKFRTDNLLRTTDLKRTFSKADMTN